MEGVGTRDISCIGNETRLTECDYEPSKNHWCGHGSPRMYDVLVVCKPNEGENRPVCFVSERARAPKHFLLDKGHKL